MFMGVNSIIDNIATCMREPVKINNTQVKNKQKNPSTVTPAVSAENILFCSRKTNLA